MANANPGFMIERRGLDLRFRTVTLESREWLAPNYVKVRLRGAELEGFDSPGSDDHMRLFFPDGPVSSVDELRSYPNREYTPLSWGGDWLEVEFAVHGDEREFVLEEAITTDFALVHAALGDRHGNLVFNKAARNFNPLAAMTGRVCIAQVEELVEPGEIDPDHVHLPGVYVHRIIEVGSDIEKRIERRTVRATEGA